MRRFVLLFLLGAACGGATPRATDAGVDIVDLADPTGCSQNPNACGAGFVCVQQPDCGSNTWACLALPEQCTARPTCECIGQAAYADGGAPSLAADLVCLHNGGDCNGYDTPSCSDGNGYIVCIEH